MRRLFSAPARVLVLAILAVSAVAIGAANDGADKEWRYYSGDNGARKYSPLDQIN
jgi:glucose dehydrogenase